MKSSVKKNKAMHGLAIFPYPAGDKEDANRLLHNSQELKRIIQGIMVDPVSTYLNCEKKNYQSTSPLKIFEKK